MNLANRLKSRRTDLKLTQKELADFAGTTQQSIQRIEDGTIRKPRNLLELAKALSCSAEWLQSGTALSYDNVSQGPENGGEPPMSTLEVRVSSLEKDVKEIKADIKNINADIKDINKSINDQTKWMSDKIESMYDKIESQTKWMVGLALTIPIAFIAIDQLLNFLNK